MELLRVSPRNPRAWKSAVDTIGSFLNEATFHFTEKGVWLQALDVSMIVFVSMEVPRSFFGVYEIRHPEIRIPISIADYQKILSRLGSSDSLTMVFSSTNLYVIMEGPTIRKEFVLPALDVREGQSAVTVPQTTAYIKVPAQHLKDALKSASIISRNVTFRSGPSYFVVESRESSSVARTEMKRSKDVLIEAEGEAVSTYSIDYLQNILRGAESDVVLEYSTDSPLKIFYKLEDIRMTFILAPLIL